MYRSLIAFSLIYLLTGCYAHGGRPYPSNQTDWQKEADLACQRGDIKAYETLYRRHSNTPPPTCPPRRENEPE